MRRKHPISLVTQTIMRLREENRKLRKDVEQANAAVTAIAEQLRQEKLAKDHFAQRNQGERSLSDYYIHETLRWRLIASKERARVAAAMEVAAKGGSVWDAIFKADVQCDLPWAEEMIGGVVEKLKEHPRRRV